MTAALRVIVVCEFSGVVRRAFRELGHDAWSCDLRPAEDGSPYHFQGDALSVIYDTSQKWDLMIAHPPCTRLANSGLRWLKVPPPGKTLEEMWHAMYAGAKFYRTVRDAPIPKKAIENPIMHHYAVALIKPKERHVVQPWWFGDPFFKATGFELFNLMPLMPTDKLTPPEPDTPEWREWSAIAFEAPSEEREKNRSRTFPGIAAAMASQWGGRVGASTFQPTITLPPPAQTSMTHMHYLQADQILVPENRQRKEFDDAGHKDLMQSIAKRGLIHPVTLRMRADGTFELVAGERRLRAIIGLYAAGATFKCNGADVPAGAVPALYTHELDPIELKEIELEENIKRRDLTPMEQIKAQKEIFELRKAQAAAEGKTYTIQDLSEELKAAGASASSFETLRTNLSIAPYIEAPAVQKAKTIKEAVKAARKESEKFLVSALAGMIEETEVDPQYQLLVGDSKDILRTLNSDRFDCVCTDPPYGIGIDDSGDMVHNEHHYDDSAEALESILEEVPPELWRITRARAHIYWFCDPRWFARISARLRDVGFDVWYRPIIWHKRGKAMAPDVTKWPRQTTEWIIYGVKGGMPTTRLGDDLISTPYGSDLQQAEKPKELIVELLSRSVMAGMHVIDPFCGSGVIFDAGRELKLHVVGIEKDVERSGLARIRASGEL